MAVKYSCGDLPGMKPCPAQFTTETEEEMWEHIALHARTAHKLDTTTWPTEAKEKVNALFRYYNDGE